MRLANNSLESIFKTQEKKITRTKDIVNFRFLNFSFEATIDDVISMTHQEIILDHDIWNQYFILTSIKKLLVMLIRFYGPFKKIMISDRNFILPMLSLNGIDFALGSF